ncbi:hypothetical protein APED_24875 [Acanthopleuribacter pedis]
MRDPGPLSQTIWLQIFSKNPSLQRFLGQKPGGRPSKPKSLVIHPKYAIMGRISHGYPAQNAGLLFFGKSLSTPIPPMRGPVRILRPAVSLTTARLHPHAGVQDVT